MYSMELILYSSLEYSLKLYLTVLLQYNLLNFLCISPMVHTYVHIGLMQFDMHVL